MIFRTLLIVFLLLSVSVSSAGASGWWTLYEDGKRAVDSGQLDRGITLLERSASVSEKASTLRLLAETYEQKGDYDAASDTYYREAGVYRRMGDETTYQAVKNIADRLRTDIELYAREDGTAQAGSRALHEPAAGMYAGAYVDAEKEVSSHDRFREFNETTGKQHAIFFSYHSLGTPFPSGTAEKIKEAGGAMQIALEPNSRHPLSSVQDNEYLRQFAVDAQKADIPVFIRFASEMNGSWVSWHGDPALYKRSFRTMAEVMHRDTDNVAMVWSPAASPAERIDAYYPGDDAVDWVGLNIYATPYLNADLNQEAFNRDPLDRLAPFYEKYAQSKPMMISEFAASHFTAAGSQDMTAYGTMRMRAFYHGLQMRFPNVHAIHWFSMNPMGNQNVPVDRRRNNFSLLENTSMLNTYRNIMKDSYFLPEVAASQDTAVVSPLENTRVHDTLQVQTHAKTYDPFIQKVFYKLNGERYQTAGSYPYSIQVNRGDLREGRNVLEAVVYDSAGRIAGRESAVLYQGPDRGSFQEKQLTLYTGDKRAYTKTGAEQLLEAPFIEKGTTLVPLRFISETFGADVGWNQQAKQISISSGEKEVLLTAGSRTAQVNGTAETLLQAPQIQRGVTFVPLRFISETLGHSVGYEAPGTVHVYP
ncbi:stalk domain-containing protein [Alkalicoccus urumqiensis]|uniref:GH26 domain-containing protein n=1 Tax=Alkalicoccus urumqiensis TaxID=1548213 RepID=A0A2P6ML85_ALKUR|nr:stalk domain-containing protein [Alkalicoccus urumqiensis]PRO67038.1 hypothetical protein C6I21_00280 [Alkalicoccus urumqiensis]